MCQPWDSISTFTVQRVSRQHDSADSRITASRNYDAHNSPWVPHRAAAGAAGTAAGPWPGHRLRPGRRHQPLAAVHRPRRRRLLVRARVAMAVAGHAVRRRQVMVRRCKVRRVAGRSARCARAAGGGHGSVARPAIGRRYAGVAAGQRRARAGGRPGRAGIATHAGATVHPSSVPLGYERVNNRIYGGGRASLAAPLRTVSMANACNRLSWQERGVVSIGMHVQHPLMQNG